MLDAARFAVAAIAGLLWLACAACNLRYGILEVVGRNPSAPSPIPLFGSFSALAVGLALPGLGGPLRGCILLSGMLRSDGAWGLGSMVSGLRERRRSG